MERLKTLIVAFVDAQSPYHIKQSIGGHEIVPIRPGSREANRIINTVGSPHQLYRVDYGNNPFRIVFGLQNENRLAHVYIVDTTHDTFSGKNK